MVRVTRFGWQDDRPIGRELELNRDRFNEEDEPQSEPQPRRRIGRPKSRSDRTSPVDRRRANNSSPTEP
jgi:hypothetical protein